MLGGYLFDTLGGLVLPKAPIFRDCLWKPLGKKGCRFGDAEKDNMVYGQLPCNHLQIWLLTPPREAKGLEESVETPLQHKG